MSASSSGTCHQSTPAGVKSLHLLVWASHEPPGPPRVEASPGRTRPPLTQLGKGSPRRHATSPRLGWHDRNAGLQRARGLLPKLPASTGSLPTAQRVATEPDCQRADDRRGRPRPVPWASPARNSRQLLELPHPSTALPTAPDWQTPPSTPRAPRRVGRPLAIFPTPRPPARGRGWWPGCGLAAATPGAARGGWRRPHTHTSIVIRRGSPPSSEEVVHRHPNK
jgi:hypothetical protein